METIRRISIKEPKMQGSVYLRLSGEVGESDPYVGFPETKNGGKHMNRFSSFMKTTAVVGILSTAVQLSADFSDCCNWDWCNCPGEWQVYGEALYWKPTYCPVNYAINRPSVQNGENIDTYRTIKSGYDWGGRVGIHYENECFLADISYLYIRPTDAAKRQPASTFAAEAAAVNAEAKIRSRYQNVDLRCGQYLMKKGDCQFYVYGNVRWVDLRLRWKVEGDNASTAFTETGFDTQETRFNGAGLGVGIGGNFDICSGFAVVGKFGFMGMIGETRFHQKYQSSSETISVQTNWPNRTCIVPGLDFRIGLNYTYECGCWDFLGEIGYEFNYYIGAIRYSDNPAPQPQATGVPVAHLAPGCQSIGFGGLYLKLAVGF